MASLPAILDVNKKGLQGNNFSYCQTGSKAGNQSAIKSFRLYFLKQPQNSQFFQNFGEDSKTMQPDNWWFQPCFNSRALAVCLNSLASYQPQPTINAPRPQRLSIAPKFYHNVKFILENKAFQPRFPFRPKKVKLNWFYPTNIFTSNTPGTRYSSACIDNNAHP